MLGPVRVNSLGFRTDLMLRTLEGSEVADHGEYLTVRSPGNPTFWWGNFLLMPESALRDDAARWITRFAQAFPDAEHVALGVDGTGGVEGTGEAAAAMAVYRGAGFQFERSTVQTSTAVREPPHRNDAVICRPLDTEDDWRQAFALRMACTEGGEPAGAREFTERRIADARRLTEAGHGSCFGAFSDGRLMAQLGVFSDGDGTARYQNVETHPAARRQGLAGTLVYHAGRYAFGGLGARTLVIVADPGYSAIRIYRSVGFADQETQLSMQREPAGK
jgi:ribosomal protein S18 acetylase RimI-like enzyme